MTVFCVPAERNQGTVSAGPRVQPLQPAGERLLWHSLCGPWETEGNCLDHVTAATYNWNTHAALLSMCQFNSYYYYLSPVKWQVFKSLSSLGSFWNVQKIKFDSSWWFSWTCGPLPIFITTLSSLCSETDSALVCISILSTFYFIKSSCGHTESRTHYEKIKELMTAHQQEQAADESALQKIKNVITGY